MKMSSIILIFIYVLFNSCTTPKDARELKKTTKEWRDSPISMYAWADTPFSGIFLVLRENGKFEHTSSGIIKSFEAGTWTFSQDTIKLVYLDCKQTLKKNQNLVIDRSSSTLQFEGESIQIMFRLRIMFSNL